MARHLFLQNWFWRAAGGDGINESICGLKNGVGGLADHVKDASDKVRDASGVNNAADSLGATVYCVGGGLMRPVTKGLAVQVKRAR